ncbi:Spo0E family sporulation regulatory protein-aspartic acid phosphatase [Virgibacillus sediminis]|uniref:Spo0E family sporulation regulatory protein-aspartic acid phosphatase n=1 Tax=Virgibacillus sediminis TaxID=202260 RepID=A0ABV7A315_9BACI
MSKSVLLEKIEECRKEMISLSDTHDLTSEVVVASSTKLDKLINEYQNYA